MSGLFRSVLAAADLNTSQAAQNAAFAAAAGSAGIGHRHDAIESAITTVALKLRSGINAVLDFGVPNDGITQAEPQIKKMLTAAAFTGVREIYFPAGTYLLTTPAGETGEPRSYAAAIILKGLRNVRVCGTKGTRFIQSAAGAGAPEFAMFRFEECENVEMCNFEADGSGINIYGTGAARSSFAFICNHDLNTRADLASANKGINIHHLKLDNFGGGISSATRTEAGFAYPLITRNLSIHNILAANIAGQNHFVGLTYTEGVHVHSNRAENPLTAAAHIGNLFADMSAGVCDALIENNVGIGFTGGGKAETHVGAGLASNEDRISQGVRFKNNRFLQIGDPVVMIYQGSGGGGWYGIKLNGAGHEATGNKITARTVNVTTGGLYQGIQLLSSATTQVDALQVAQQNDITGTVLGVNHDSPNDPGRKYSASIRGNIIRDTVRPATLVEANDGTGIIASKNCEVIGNKLYRTAYAAITLQGPDETACRENVAYDCAAVPLVATGVRTVYTQAGGGAQGYFEFAENRIVDSRGAAAAHVGYYMEAGTTYANDYGFRPGLCRGLLSAVAFDKYAGAIDGSLQRSGSLVPAPRTFLVGNRPDLIAPWNGMSFNVGDRAVLDPPVVGSIKAWVLVSNAPVTWASEGPL